MTDIEELWQGYDLNGLPTVPLTKQQARTGMLHGASHVWIWRQADNGIEIMLQRRAYDKPTWPGFLDISAAGHIDAQESPLQAAVRETQEEIGVALTSTDLHFLFACHAYLLPPNSDIVEHEFRWVYAYEWHEQALQFADREVEEVVWMSVEDLKAAAHGDSAEKLVPHGDAYLAMLYEGLDLIRKLES